MDADKIKEWIEFKTIKRTGIEMEWASRGHIVDFVKYWGKKWTTMLIHDFFFLSKLFEISCLIIERHQICSDKRKFTWFMRVRWRHETIPCWHQHFLIMWLMIDWRPDIPLFFFFWPSFLKHILVFLAPKKKKKPILIYRAFYMPFFYAFFFS